MTKRLRMPSDPLCANPKLFIEELGYDIDTDSDQRGQWVWTSSHDGYESSFATPLLALESAWDDAVRRTLANGGVTEEEWLAADFEGKRVAMTLALTGEVPSFESLRLETQLKWVDRVRERNEDFGNQKAMRFAEQDYLDARGKLPPSRKR